MAEAKNKPLMCRNRSYISKICTIPGYKCVFLLPAVIHIPDWPSITQSMGNKQLLRLKLLKRWVNVYIYSLFVWLVCVILFWYGLSSSFRGTQTLDPVWNEEFFFSVSENELSRNILKCVRLAVWLFVFTYMCQEIKKSWCCLCWTHILCILTIHIMLCFRFFPGCIVCCLRCLMKIVW